MRGSLPVENYAAISPNSKKAPISEERERGTSARRQQSAEKGTRAAFKGALIDRVNRPSFLFVPEAECIVPYTQLHTR